MFASCSVSSAEDSIYWVWGRPLNWTCSTLQGCDSVTVVMTPCVSSLCQDAASTDNWVLQPLRTSSSTTTPHDSFSTNCFRQPPPDPHAAPLPCLCRLLLRHSSSPSHRWAHGHSPTTSRPTASSTGPSWCRLFSLILPDAWPPCSWGEAPRDSTATHKWRSKWSSCCHSNG